jgi:hypothetical protein
LASPEVDVCGREVIDTLVITPMIVMIDECLDLLFQVCWEEEVLQQDPVLQGLMPPLDLTLSLWLIWRTSDMSHFFSSSHSASSPET